MRADGANSLSAARVGRDFCLSLTGSVVESRLSGTRAEWGSLWRATWVTGSDGLAK